MAFAEQAVYTILNPKLLAEWASSTDDAQLRETKRWVTAKRYFDDAQRRGLEMAVIYADAAQDCSKLIYWGRLTSVEVDADGTSYTVAGLTPLTGHRTQELVLLSTSEQIAPGYIRPYAVVRRPPFLVQTT
ncbi:MAG TPA: hypothetical protein VFQ61_39710, partial [Polyangiaceae bacterium]|nr:hypothetical protein [Polyangiaceae bacterium]